MLCLALGRTQWLALNNHKNKQQNKTTKKQGEVKGELIQILTDVVGRHQAARSQVTDDVVDAFMAVRPMQGALRPSR